MISFFRHRKSKNEVDNAEVRSNYDFIRIVRKIGIQKIEERGLKSLITINSANSKTKNCCLYFRPKGANKPTTQIIPTCKEHDPFKFTLEKEMDRILNQIDSKLQEQVKKMNGENSKSGNMSRFE